MISCPSCNTLNPDSERSCLACGAGLTGDPGYGRSSVDTGAAGPSRTVVEDLELKTCPNGHPVDPTWSDCPYCQRAGSVRSVTRLERTTGPLRDDPRKTRLETDTARDSRRTRLAGEMTFAPPSPAPPPARPAVPPEPRVRPTRLEEPQEVSVGTRRRTVLSPGTSEPSRSRSAQPASGVEDTRPLVAVLAAPALRPGGAVFPVRSGKNTLGADPTSQVWLAEDPRVSSEHALLLFRQNGFFLADRMSTNGTFINGVELEGTHAVALQDRDCIRCGDTELVFLTLDPVGSGSVGTEPNSEGETS